MPTECLLFLDLYGPPRFHCRCLKHASLSVPFLLFPPMNYRDHLCECRNCRKVEDQMLWLIVDLAMRFFEITATFTWMTSSFHFSLSTSLSVGTSSSASDFPYPRLWDHFFLFSSGTCHLTTFLRRFILNYCFQAGALNMGKCLVPYSTGSPLESSEWTQPCLQENRRAWCPQFSGNLLHSNAANSNRASKVSVWSCVRLKVQMKKTVIEFFHSDTSPFYEDTQIIQDNLLSQNLLIQ